MTQSTSLSWLIASKFPWPPNWRGLLPGPALISRAWFFLPPDRCKGSTARRSGDGSKKATAHRLRTGKWFASITTGRGQRNQDGAASYNQGRSGGNGTRLGRLAAKGKHKSECLVGAVWPIDGPLGAAYPGTRAHLVTSIKINFQMLIRQYLDLNPKYRNQPSDCWTSSPENK